MSILMNKSDAEEATQDVFLAAVREADRFQGNRALHPWIYRICVNSCLARRGRKRPRSRIFCRSSPKRARMRSRSRTGAGTSSAGFRIGSSER
ncbi:MAG: hypothetical protein B7Z62_05255 [Deltaproteobacteria bacterium 37-65-8]|nr:MAG: hypothetical protein B7Z62_05255 [Deltaproteobacteria bacterium 37-65-8]